MIKAARCPGKTCEVGLALWFLVGVTKKKTVKLTNALTGELGVPPRTKLRAVDALEEAGLISVIRHPGRSPLVTIKED
ncbi:MAG: hypothetical protein HOD92_22955 [Deltaproteobacteria bacterium]|nr:hypothetical protein [Deltaproteobacteria bacterium]